MNYTVKVVHVVDASVIQELGRGQLKPENCGSVYTSPSAAQRAIHSFIKKSGDSAGDFVFIFTPATPLKG